MKKWGFLSISALCLIFIVNISQNKVESQTYEQNESDTLEVEVQKYEQNGNDTVEIECTEEQIYQGDLLLVNNEYPIQQAGIKSDILNLFTHKELTTGYELLDNEMKLSEEIAEEFSEMIVAAEEDGVNDFII